MTVHSHSKPNDAPNLASPSLWFHNVSNTVITGLTGNTPTFESEGTEEPPLSLWAFQTNNEGNVSWSPFISVDDPVWQSLVRPYRPLQAYGRDKAFAAGGTDPSIVEGMISFNMDSQELVNATSANTTFSAGLSRGAMQYIESYGEEGIYILIGGTNGALKAGPLIGFGTVLIFDPGTGSWFNQSTTGKPPEARDDCCAAAVSVNGSHDMYVHGTPECN